MIGLIAVISTVVLAVTFAGAARVIRHRAQTAADLGALAAARLAFADPDAGCAEAASLAVTNGARLTRCVVGDGGVATVRVVVSFTLPVVGAEEVMAHARAGPVHITEPAG
ncbi:hypothetical protein Psi01_15070 [Planobispora siamensis]|uniref:Putative Flp pilus-assembly TadG-like N-terminal domain-containing protein n=2 Tax=Planobispora siamensis TaxID=936338 RepID=A0A8J3SAH2_9ACTN|nr:hypothetical protein Psi01_15070 [Planobispora siamensis]